jgi:hypothetical protein
MEQLDSHAFWSGYWAPPAQGVLGVSHRSGPRHSGSLACLCAACRWASTPPPSVKKWNNLKVLLVLRVVSDKRAMVAQQLCCQAVTGYMPSPSTAVTHRQQQPTRTWYSQHAAADPHAGVCACLSMRLCNSSLTAAAQTAAAHTAAAAKSLS